MSDMTLAEAAKAVGKSPVTLRAAVNGGKLKSYQKGRVHFVNLNDVVALFAERSRSDTRSKAAVGDIANSDSEGMLISVVQAQIRALENERDYLRQMLDLEKKEKADLMRELIQRTAEIKAFLENRPGLFKFLAR